MGPRHHDAARANRWHPRPHEATVKRANGQRVGSTPYGYDLAKDGATLIENPAEQAVIREIETMRESGVSLRKIAKQLTERGVPTKQGKSPRWSFQSVSRILGRESQPLLRGTG